MSCLTSPCCQAGVLKSAGPRPPFDYKALKGRKKAIRKKRERLQISFSVFGTIAAIGTVFACFNGLYLLL